MNECWENCDSCDDEKCPFHEKNYDEKRITKLLEEKLKKEKERKVRRDYNTEWNSEHLVYDWFNVRNVGDIKESLKLIGDDTEIDIDLRLISNLKSNKKELQFKKPERY